MRIAFEATTVAVWRQAFALAPQAAAEEMQAFLTRSTAHLQAEVQARTPTTHGTLRASVFGEVRMFGGGFGMEGLVATPLAHAPAVEHGTKPHHPPVEPLIDWARQKLALSGTEAERAGRAIAWKIARHGTQGAHMFRDAFNENREQVMADFRRSGMRVVRRIEGGMR
ncbi:MAG: hypothetical protein ACK4KV_19005 [Rhodocyclaceae bacterium]